MNITDPIRRIAQLTPEAVAVLHFGNVVTYREFNALIDSLATRISGIGLRPGDAAGLLGANHYGPLALTLALARLGVAAAISRPVVEGVGGVSLKACFVDTAGAGAAVAGSVMVDDSWWRSPSSAEQGAPVPSWPDGKATCLLVSSSGTTGVPKAIALSHDTLRTRLFAKWLAMRAPDSARQICTLGLESYYGFYSTLRVLWTGGLVVTALKWSDFHVAIPSHKLNSLIMSPAQLHALLGALPQGAGPFPTLEVMEVGGSMLPSSLASQARARLCENIHVAYGAAEAGVVASAPLAVLERHPGTVGFIAPGIEVQAVDADHRPLPAGAEGIIRIRSANCIAAYHGDPEASTKSFRDGWFYPGDVGSVSGNGLLAISGRSSEIINSGGVKVSPQLVEDVVLMNPDVSEAAAFAVPDAATGMQEIWVAIVQKNPVDTDALHGLCVQRLGQKAPKSFLLVKELPRNENGKVLRDQLTKMATEDGVISLGTVGRP
jgi:acyl-CoA synthetase (AMP-forming)/AMP-acid ligase II